MWARFALLVALVPGPALASTPEEIARLDEASAAACSEAAALKDSTVGEPIRFSDDLGVDARMVDGIWPQPHMNGAAARMLCLYDRATGRAEVQELPAE